MGKVYSVGDSVVVDFAGKKCHARLVGRDGDVLIVDGSPVFGEVPMFPDDGKDHTDQFDCCYVSEEKDSKTLGPVSNA